MAVKKNTLSKKKVKKKSVVKKKVLKKKVAKKAAAKKKVVGKKAANKKTGKKKAIQKLISKPKPKSSTRTSSTEKKTNKKPVKPQTRRGGKMSIGSCVKVIKGKSIGQVGKIVRQDPCLGTFFLNYDCHAKDPIYKRMEWGPFFSSSLELC